MTRPKTYDEQQLLVAASLYYIDGLNQDEIAQRFKVSRPTIVRMLKEVREQGLIEIKLTKSLPHTSVMEAEIESRFADKNLNQVIVMDQNDLDQKQVVARAAGNYLEKTLRDNDILGVGWSTTLAHLPSFVTRPRHHPETIVQLAGAAGSIFGSNSHEISIRLSQTTIAPVAHLPSPIFLSTEEARNAVMKDKGLQSTADLFKQCTIAVIGIGEVSRNSTLVRSGYISSKEMDAISRAGGAGDILAHFYNDQGDELETKWDKLRVSIDLDQIKKIDNVIAISAGKSKAGAVKGAVRGGYINTLIIDITLAKELLN